MTRTLLIGSTLTAFASLAAVTSASAAKMQRIDAVAQCIEFMQKQAPNPNGDDVVSSARVRIYSSCMKDKGFRP